MAPWKVQRASHPLTCCCERGSDGRTAAQAEQPRLRYVQTRSSDDLQNVYPHLIWNLAAFCSLERLHTNCALFCS
ncbi:hypothetical protein V5799_021574 [Amblyomma americanum]|uniref:Uncharacterized protein n=1 Tax=Amblyomma americanum TaxID=6943 RepID=A0AAQ4FN09_AMBAM